MSTFIAHIKAYSDWLNREHPFTLPYPHEGEGPNLRVMDTSNSKQWNTCFHFLHELKSEHYPEKIL